MVEQLNNCVKQIILDTDTSSVISDETAEGVNASLCKLDTVINQLKLTGQHGDDGGGVTGRSPMEAFSDKYRIKN